MAAYWDDHKTLLQVLRAASTSTHTANAFLKLAISCGFVVAVTQKKEDASDAPGCSSLFPSGKCIAGLSTLVAAGHFSLFTDPTVCSSAHCSTEVRCEVVEPVCAVMLLFPDVFHRGVRSSSCSADRSPTVDLESTGESFDEPSGTNSLDTSVDLTPSSAAAARLTSSFQFGSGLNPILLDVSSPDAADMGCLRDSLALELLLKIDEQLRIGQLRLFGLQQHTSKHSQGSSATAALKQPLVGRAQLVGVQQRLCHLMWWKALIVACISVAASEGGPHAATLGSVCEMPMGSSTTSWLHRPVRQWGWSSLPLAERQFDAVVDASRGLLLRPLAVPAKVRTTCSPLVALGAPLPPTSSVTPAAPGGIPSLTPPWQAPAAPQLVGDVAELYKLGWMGSEQQMLLFDTVESPFSNLLAQSTQRRLTPLQLKQIMASLESTGPVFGPCIARHKILLTVLQQNEKLYALAEKNKELFVSLFRHLHGLSEEASNPMHLPALIVRDIVVALLSMSIGEPSCHIVKVLYDEGFISDEELSLYVDNAVREIDSFVSLHPSSAATTGAIASPDGGAQRAQRSATILSLMLQNMCLSKKRIVVTPPVEAIVMAFCVEFGKLKCCTDLYGTIAGLKR